MAEAILGLDYDGTLIHDGWSPYDQFEDARHQQCLNHLLRRADAMAATATRGAVRFPRRVAELLRGGLALAGAGRLVKLAPEAFVLGLQVVQASLKGLAAGTRDGFHTPIIGLV